ncbi:MAG: hypothetical protein EON98_12840, partial [Chitinophagaceae bacterium]
FTKQEDIEFVNRHSAMGNRQSGKENPEPQTPNPQPQTFFCLCVNANQYIEGVMPPVELFRKNGCRIVLGTDSLASNWSLSILDEMKTIRKHFPAIPLEEMLQWATINGANALGFDETLGSFENGKRPGVILLDGEDLVVKKLLF